MAHLPRLVPTLLRSVVVLGLVVATVWLFSARRPGGTNENLLWSWFGLAFAMGLVAAHRRALLLAATPTARFWYRWLRGDIAVVGDEILQVAIWMTIVITIGVLGIALGAVLGWILKDTGLGRSG